MNVSTIIRSGLGASMFAGLLATTGCPATSSNPPKADMTSGNQGDMGNIVPPDGGTTDGGKDGGGADGSTISLHKGTSVMSGGVTATSANFKIIMSTGQAPGGNANGTSANFKARSGLAGATQP